MNEVNNTAKFIGQLQKFSTVAFVPKGNSMYPFIKNKAQVVYISKKEKRLTPYDVGLFVREDGGLVLHRVIELVDDGYLFCGDSQFNLERVKEEAVVGVLVATQRGKDSKAFTEKDREKAKKWYKNKGYRKFRIAIHSFLVGLALKTKNIFKRDK